MIAAAGEETGGAAPCEHAAVAAERWHPAPDKLHFGTGV